CWVDSQAKNEVLMKQIIRRALLTKLDVEHKFINFRITGYGIETLATLIQIALCLTSFKLLALRPLLEVLISTDLSKLDIPGIGLVKLFHPLYPELSFKVKNMMM